MLPFEDSPFNKGKYAYVAWTPCVSGRLSLRHIGTGQIHKNNLVCPSAHAVIDEKTFAACYFQTDTKDFRVKESHGEWHAMLTLKQTDCQNICYEGSVYWWLKKTEERGFFSIVKTILNSFSSKNSTSIKDLLLPTFSEIENLQKSRKKDTEGWLKLWNKLINTATSETSYFRLKTNFLLEDDGLVYLTRSKKSKNGEIEQLNNKEDLITGRQSFYIIKQCLHLHKHHEPSDDALTTAHDIEQIKTKFPSNPGLALVNDLKASLIDQHRTIYGKYSELNKVNGITAYSNSLAETLFRKHLITKVELETQLVYISNIRTSIATTAKSIEFKSEERVSRLELKRNHIMLVLAMVAPQILIYRTQLQNQIDSESSIFTLLTKTVIHPEFWLIILFYYFLFPHLKFSAFAKRALFRTKLWGSGLVSVINTTSPTFFRSLTFFAQIVGVASIIAGTMIYLQRVM